MARVKIEGIIDHLDTEIQRALEETVRAVVHPADFDAHELFREFKRNVGRRCSTWERVPDKYVEKEP